MSFETDIDEGEAPELQSSDVDLPSPGKLVRIADHQLELERWGAFHKMRRRFHPDIRRCRNTAKPSPSFMAGQNPLLRGDWD